MDNLEGGSTAAVLGDAIASKAESLSSAQLPVAAVQHSAVLKLKGLPYSATEEAILQFFAGFNVEKVSFVMEPDNRPSGLAFAEFASKEECLKALTKNGDYIGERYVRLLHVPKSEMEEQVRLGTLAIPGAAAKLRSRVMRNTPTQLQLDGLHSGGMQGLPGFYGQAGGMPGYGLQPGGGGGGGGQVFMGPGLLNGARGGGGGGGGGIFAAGGGGVDGQRGPGWPNANFQQAQGFGNQGNYSQPSQVQLLQGYGQQLPAYNQQNQGYGQQVQGGGNGGASSYMSQQNQQQQQQQANYNNSPAALAAQFGSLSMGGGRAGTAAGTGDAGFSAASNFSRLGGGGQYQDLNNSGLINLGTGLGGNGGVGMRGGPFSAGLGQAAVGAAIAQAVGGGGGAAAGGAIGSNPLSVASSGTIKIRGLPYRSSPQDILAFFQNYSFLGDSLQIGLDSLGRPSGEAWLTFTDPVEAARAVKELNRHYLGNRYLELSVC